jgi:hypothetical protein
VRASRGANSSPTFSAPCRSASAVALA